MTKRIVQNTGENHSWFEANFNRNEWEIIEAFIELAHEAGAMTDYSYVSSFCFQGDEDFTEPQYDGEKVYTEDELLESIHKKSIKKND